MRSIWIGLAAALAFSPAWAQKITVKKVKGNQAVVQINGGTVSAGQSYALTQGEGDDMSAGSTTSGPRNKYLGLGVNFSSLSTDSGTGTKNTTSGYGFDVLYGWNKGSYEYGVLGTFGSRDAGSGATTTFGVGGNFDWNLSPNKVGNDRLFGLGFLGKYLSASGSGGAKGTTTMYLYPSAYMKWFLIGTATAFRVDLGYRMEDSSTGSAKSKVTGIDLKGALYSYF